MTFRESLRFNRNALCWKMECKFCPFQKLQGKNCLNDEVYSDNDFALLILEMHNRCEEELLNAVEELIKS